MITPKNFPYLLAQQKKNTLRKTFILACLVQMYAYIYRIIKYTHIHIISNATQNLKKDMNVNIVNKFHNAFFFPSTKKSSFSSPLLTFSF